MLELRSGYLVVELSPTEIVIDAEVYDDRVAPSFEEAELFKT